MDGRVVERQEFPILLAGRHGELQALAAAGALLLLGVPPETLADWSGSLPGHLGRLDGGQERGDMLQ